MLFIGRHYKMNPLNKIIFLFTAGMMIATALTAEPIQANEDLKKARENILAGTVGKPESPIIGVAQENVGDENENGEESKKDTGSSKKKSSKNSKSTVPKKPAYSYHDEKILNWLYATKADVAKENNPGATVKTVAFRGVFADSNKTTGSVSSMVASNNLNAAKPFNIFGSCTIPESVEMAGNTRGVLTAYCQTKQGKYKLVGNLTPKPEEYSLVATPIYVEDTYGKRFYVDNNKSFVLNSRKNSYNIATFVNTHALDKVVRESIKSGSKNISSTATQYMQDLKASRTKQETTMVANAGATTATNTETPRSSDYLTILGIQMSADMIDKWADYAFQENAWGFMIIAQTKIYIDLSVEEEKK